MPRYCLPCGERRRDVLATVMLDGDPMCSICAGLLKMELAKSGGLPLPERAIGAEAAKAAPASPAARLCAQHCGKPVHRGRCGAGRAVGPLERLKEAAARVPLAPSRPASPPAYQPGPRQAVAVIPQPAAPPAAKAKVAQLDKLSAEIIRDDQMPSEEVAPVLVRSMGRMGEMWDALEALPAGCWLAVNNRDRNHLTYTARLLREGMKRRNLQLQMREHGHRLYVRHAPPESGEAP